MDLKQPKMECLRVQFYFLPVFFIIFITCVALFAFPQAGFEKQPGRRLNLLLITIDTLRADRLSCYNSEHLKTPQIDSLASRGILFIRAFAHSTMTLPSHTNILLGTTPLYHGVHDNANFVVRDEFLTLAEHMRKFGYSTGAFVGAFPLDSRFGLSQGFEVYDDKYLQHSHKETAKERRAEVVVDAAMEWLNRQRGLWFLWIHCFDPHDPYTPPEPYKTQFEKRPYDGEVAYVDSAMGKLFRFMEKDDLFSNTMVVFTGDHGESLGEHGEETHGFLAYNATLWVPLIISVPGMKPGKANQNVSHIDIFPTICDALKIESPAFLQGISLVPAIKGKKLVDRHIFFESLSPYYSLGWAPIRGYYEKEGKFIDSPIPEFYDLKGDFSEINNLAKQKDLAEYRKKLANIISSQMLAESSKAERRTDRETLERLRSLGYLSGAQETKKEQFGPENDVKVLLPYYYRAAQALEMSSKGKVKEGIQLLKEIITENKSIPHAYTNLAVIYKESGRIKDALEVLRMGFEHMPANYDIFSGIVTFLMEDSQYDAVIEGVKEFPFREMDYDPAIWNHAGLAFWYKGNTEEAQKCWEKSIEIDGKFSNAYSNLGTLYFSIFKETKDAKALEMAIRNIKKAIELDPFNSNCYNSLGLVNLEAGAYEDAIHNLEQALGLNPDSDDVVYNLGAAHMKKGNHSEALAYFNRVKTSPSYKNFSSSEKAELERFIKMCSSRIEKR